MPQFSLDIVSCQKGWMAVDKPCGLSVHNDPGNDLISLLEEKIASDSKLAQLLGTQNPIKVYPVHRLDKETSGIILLATDKKILAQLSDLFSKGEVEKKYVALVHGIIENSNNDVYHFWDTALSKSAAGRKNPKGSGKLFKCKTGFKLLGQSEHYSLLKINLYTGRKHQIRRHAKLAGHPVVGDGRYGSKRAIEFLKKKKNYSRLGLHCQSLGFKLPEQGESIFISSNNPLPEMKQLIADDK